MLTGRSLTVCWRLLPGGWCMVRGVWSGGSAPRGCLLPEGSAPGGCLLPGGYGPGGVCSRGVVWSGGVCAPGDLARGGSGPGVWSGGVWWYPSMHWGRTAPLWTESQTPVKTLPWPNFVATGNKEFSIKAFSANCNQFYIIILLVNPFLLPIFISQRKKVKAQKNKKPI